MIGIFLVQEPPEYGETIDKTKLSELTKEFEKVKEIELELCNEKHSHDQKQPLTKTPCD